MIRLTQRIWNTSKPATGQTTDGRCPTCLDVGRVRIQINGDEYEVFCHCQLHKWLAARAERWNRLSNISHGVDLPDFDQFETVDLPAWEQMAKAIELGKSLVESPLEHQWMTVLGMNGCGKTMLLQSIYRHLRGYAAYLGAGRIGTIIFKSFDDNSTQDLMQDLEDVSVLLIDDYGVEDVKGTVGNRITEIIDRRYSYGVYRPTVIASNKTRKELRKQNNRVADRILDKKLVQVFDIGLPSYRQDTQLELPDATPVVRRKG